MTLPPGVKPGDLVRIALAGAGLQYLVSFVAEHHRRLGSVEAQLRRKVPAEDLVRLRDLAELAAVATDQELRLGELAERLRALEERRG